jgi:hypothetical protein
MDIEFALETAANMTCLGHFLATFKGSAGRVSRFQLVYAL